MSLKTTGWKQKADQLLKEALVFYFVSRHPRTPWYVKLVAASSVAYTLSPVQVIPSFIPVIGFLDDFVVLSIGAQLVGKLTPADLLQECRKSAEAAAITNKMKLSVGSPTLLPVAVGLLLAAAAASAFIFVHFFHFW